MVFVSSTPSPTANDHEDDSTQPDAAPQTTTDGNNEILSIQQASLKLGVAALISMRDCQDLKLTDDPVILNWLKENYHNSELCVLSDYSILTSSPFTPIIRTVRTVIEQQTGQGIITIRPALQRIVEAIRDRAKIAQQAQQAKPAITKNRDDSRIRKLLDTLIATAQEMQVSDIHFEKRTHITTIRFRRAGYLTNFDEISNEDMDALCNLIFNAMVDRGARHFTPNQPLNGAIHIRLGTHMVPIRVNTATELRGLDLIMRLLVSTPKPIKLSEAGYTPLHLSLIRQAMNYPYGAIVMSGPTGSGKSTSLTAALDWVDRRQKIISLEDPVEQMLSHVSHIPVNEHIENHSWEKLLCEINRWDSNINMLGEIRDRATCNAVKQLVTCGKLTITTLHASHILAIPRRLEDLGIEHSLLSEAGFLVCLINQRLVPRLCNHCKLDWQEGDIDNLRRAHLENILTLSKVKLVNTKGCKKCHHSGHSGRVLLAEVMLLDDRGREFIRQRNTHDWRKHLVKMGWPSIHIHALEVVNDGLIDPTVTENIIGPLDGSMNHIDVNYHEQQRLV